MGYYHWLVVEGAKLKLALGLPNWNIHDFHGAQSFCQNVFTKCHTREPVTQRLKIRMVTKRTFWLYCYSRTFHNPNLLGA